MAIVNFIKNGSYESNVEWELSSSAVYSTEYPKDGVRTVRCTHTQNNPEVHVTQWVTLVPGKKYSLKAYIKRTGSIGYYPSVLFRFTNGSYEYYDAPDSFANDKTDGYRTWDFTVPSNQKPTEKIQIRLNTKPLVSPISGTNIMWIDDVQLLGESIETGGSGGSGTDIIQNGSFEAGNNPWLFNNTASGIVSGNAYSGSKCAMLPVVVGSSSRNVEQYVDLVPGAKYSFVFYAKSTASLNMSMSCAYKDSVGVEQCLYVVGRGANVSGSYTRQEFSFTLPKDMSTNRCRMSINASAVSANGALYVDNVELWGEAASGGTGTDPGTPSDGTYVAGHYGKLTVKAYVRPNAKKEDINNGEFPSGSAFVISGTEAGQSIDGNTTWVKICFGNQNGTTEYRYVHSSCIQDTGTAAPNSAKSRALAIAPTLQGCTEGNLGLSGNYCQAFLNWLCGASGMPPSNMMYDDLHCGPVRNFYRSQNQYKTKGAYIPNPGDFVYYEGADDSKSAHVGLIIGRDTTKNQYTAIEGNITENNKNIVKLVTGDYVTGKVETHSRTVEGFATPSWT